MLKGRGYLKIVEEAQAIENINEFMLEQPYDPSFLGQAEDVTVYFDKPNGLTTIGKNLALLGQHMRDGDNVLDAGCYGGYTYDWLNKNFDGNFQYVGFDIQEQSIIEAAAAHGKEYSELLSFRQMLQYEKSPYFVHSDLFDLPEPFGEKAFDVVFCSRVAIHLPSFEEIVKCLWKVTSRTLLITIKLGEDRAIRQKVNGEGIVYFRYISEETIDQTMKRCGLTYKLFKNGKYQTLVIGETI